MEDALEIVEMFLNKKLYYHLRTSPGTPGTMDVMEEYYRDPWGQEGRLTLSRIKALDDLKNLKKSI